MELMAIAVLAIWALSCVWCGYAVRPAFFASEVIFGLALAAGYIAIALEQPALGADALSIYLSVILFAIGCFGTGWLIGRFVRGLRESRTD